MQSNNTKKLKKGRGAQFNVHNPFEKNQIVQEHWEGLDLDTEKEAPHRTVYQEVFPKSIVNKVDSPDIPMNWSMNPYQGCEHGCIYCYARNTHTYWGYSSGTEFENVILVKKNAPDLLAQKLKSRFWKGESIMLSGNTDCYQPAEKKLEITRKCLEVFLKFKNPVGIITKNDLLLRDMDILKELAQLRLVSVAVSITTLNEDLRRAMEPRTSTGQRRVEMVAKLSEAGIKVGVLMAPVIPYLNHEEIPDLVKAVSEAGAANIYHLMVRLNNQNGALFQDWVKRHFPERSEKVVNQIRALHEGNLNDSTFGQRMRGVGHEADAISKLMKLSKKKYFTPKAFYQLRKERIRPKQLGLF
ncbi:MAG: radical SAM protein [Crocinitomicaceae bacterium]|nr:radical SAM protein [Crocinitomicaceae bacterium]|tara:strand:- start:3348 stop:4415 length:1068 start_codon:yes stop_codon:yes gene_type:complete